MAVKIKGTIVKNEDKWIYDWCGIEATAPNDVEKQMNEDSGKEIIIEVNSGGGDVFAGNEIYYMIQSQKKKTVCYITGFAGSAATIICCAADHVAAVPGAHYMIHNVSTTNKGDYNSMDKVSEILKTANKTISNVYRLKTGLNEEELLDLMNKETWMDATKAMELKFIDSIIGDNGILTKGTFTINNSFTTILSNEVKEKIRTEIRNPNQKNYTDFFMQKEKLNLLKMKGEIKNEF